MTRNKHTIEPDELMAYLDGELPSDRAAATVAHLENCLECEAFAAELREMSRQMMAWEVETLEAQIFPHIAAALEEREQRSKPDTVKVAEPSRGSMFARRWAWVGGFTVAALLVGSAVLMPHLNRRVPARAALALPPVSGANDRFRGQGSADKGAFSRDQPLKDLIKGGVGIAGNLSAPVNGRYDKLEQFAKLQASPPASPPSEFKEAIPASHGGSVPAGPMIIRTAGITLTTNDFDRARTGLDDVLKRHHGYVGELNVSTPTGSGRSFTATLRIPADQIDATLADLRKLGRVESESQSGEEVTSQYVDLQARLANARNTEQRLTDLLNQRTGKLSDVLAFEKEIDRVRGEIEQMEAERKTLANQVDFATVNTTVTEIYKAELQFAPVSTSSRIWNAAVEGYRSMVEGIVSVVLFAFSYGPSLLLWCAILFFPARFAWKKVRERRAA